jgi:hypothetical protein
MKIFKTTLALACAGFIAFPAYSQTAAKPAATNRTTPNSVTANGVTFNPDNPGDTKQILFSKKAYIQQIEQTFDRLDANGDGVIDSQEMANRSKIDQSGARADYDEDPADIASSKNKKPATANTAARKTSGGTVSPLNSIPPVNSKDLR